MCCFPVCFLGESVGAAPPEVVHQLESLPHVRLVEGVHPSIHRVLLGVRGTGGTRRGRCGHQTGKTWEAVSGWLEIDDYLTVRSSVSWVTRGGWDRDVTPDTSDEMDQTDTCSVTVVSIVLHHRKGSSVKSPFCLFWWFPSGQLWGALSLSMPRCLPVPAIFESLYDATDPSSLNNPRFFMVICSGCHGTQMLLQDCGILIRFLKWIPITYTIINMASGRHIGIAWLVSRTATNNYLYYPLSRWLFSGVVN